MTRRPRLLLACAAFFPLALAGLAARADGAKKVTVQVTQILATGREGGPKEIEPALAELKGQLEHSLYHKFRKAGQEAKAASDGESVEFPLRGNFSLTVVPSEGSGGFVQLEVTVRDLKDPKSAPPRLQTKLSLKDGGTILITKDFGDETGDGRLFLALTVKRTG
jgi:hypothetical protein